VIVVSHDGFNQAPGWRSVIVVPVSTSTAQAARGPTAVQYEKARAAAERFLKSHTAWEIVEFVKKVAPYASAPASNVAPVRSRNGHRRPR
jgi:hypothetical protein